MVVTSFPEEGLARGPGYDSLVLTCFPEEGLARCGELGVEEEPAPSTAATWGGERVLPR